MSLTIGSLFSGIGGLELGLEWAGLGPVLWQVEKDPFCCAVLAKHWPDVPRWNDVQTVRASQLRPVDIICGGFPCQDVSSAGKRKGMRGARSGLWWDFARIIDAARPRFVVVENVASGATKWLPMVRQHLHLLGYRTRALGVSAAELGAPHLRRRVFVVAYADGVAPGRVARSLRPSASPDPDSNKLREQSRRGRGKEGRGSSVAGVDGEAGSAPDASGHQNPMGPPAGSNLSGSWNGGRDGGAPVSAVRRVDDGLSRRLDAARKRALGNAVVPQCAQVVGEVIRQLAGLNNGCDSGGNFRTPSADSVKPRAKEGSRTPTGITPQEPESSASVTIQPKTSVSAESCRQESAENCGTMTDCGGNSQKGGE